MKRVEDIYGENAERRFFDPEDLELRVVRDVDGKAQKISGYAAVFNRLSENLGGYVEKIRPGAFKNALRKSDVRALFNHNPDLIIGREGANLTLTEKTRGLFMELERPNVKSERFEQVAADIENGFVTQQSFAFRLKEGGDKWKYGDPSKGELDVRTIIEVDELFDVSPVTYPAYPDTTVAFRSLEKSKKSNPSIGNGPSAKRQRELRYRELKFKRSTR